MSQRWSRREQRLGPERRSDESHAELMEAPALLPLEERSPARQKIQLSPRARVPEMSPSQWKAPQLTDGDPGASSRPLRCSHQWHQRCPLHLGQRGDPPRWRVAELSLTSSPAFMKVSMAPPREQQRGQTGRIPSLLLPLPLISLIPLTDGRPRPTPPSEGHAHLEVPPVNSAFCRGAPVLLCSILPAD